MKTIYKYKLQSLSGQRVDIPRNAHFLSVQEQHGEPVMWWLVDTDYPPEAHRFAIYGTGHYMPDSPGAYLGTFQVRDGELVFHLFEVT